MKKLLLLLLIIPFIGKTQGDVYGDRGIFRTVYVGSNPTYGRYLDSLINDTTGWIGKVKSYPTAHAIATFVANRVAAIGGTTEDASEGLTKSGLNINLGGLVTSPGVLTTDRNILANRRVLVFGNTIPGMAKWQFSDSAYSPFQFLSSDTITSNDMSLSRTRPLSGVYAQRNVVYAPGVYQQTKMYGHRLGFTTIWTDTVKIRTDGSDYHSNIIEFRFSPTGTGRQVAKIGHGTGSENDAGEAVSALIANMYVDNPDLNSTDSTVINGTIAGIVPYLVANLGTAKIRIKRYVSVQPNNFIGVNTKIEKYVDYGSRFKVGTNSILVDSAYFLEDSSMFKRNYLRGKTVIGAGSWSSNDQLKVGGNVNITDSLIIGKATNIADTTGYDFVLRKRTDGALMRITASQMAGFFGGGNTPGIDDVLAQNQDLTSNRVIDLNGNRIDIMNGATGVGQIAPTFINLAAVNGNDLTGFDIVSNGTLNRSVLYSYWDFGSKTASVTTSSSSISGKITLDADSIIANPISILTADTTNYKLVVIGPGNHLAKANWASTGTGGGGGSGTVNSGTANRLTYYPSTGTTVDDLPAITANRAIVSDANGLPTHSTTTNTEIGYVAGVTSNIQTQLNSKQKSIAYKRVFYAQAGSTSMVTVGTNNVTTSGSLAGITPNTSSLLNSQRNVQFNTGATAGSTTRANNTNVEVVRGDATGIGGFLCVLRFATYSLVDGNRAFFGLIDGATALTNVDHRTNTAIARIGMYIDDDTGNWNIIHNTNGSSATSIDLGSNFPINNTDLYELTLSCDPNASTVSYYVSNLTTGNTTSGTISTNLPAASSYMAMHCWMNNNATASGCGFWLSKMYSESN